MLMYMLVWHRISVSNEKWETLEGTFVLTTVPNRVVIYLEGPNPGTDLLVKSVTISCSSPVEVTFIPKSYWKNTQT